MSGSNKLIYQVMEVSSEDDSYPISELLAQKSKGYQSQRFTMYPVEITLSLNQFSRVENLQILTHAFKIPAKMDILVGI